MPDLQYQVRKKVGDIRNTLPAGIQGPFFNDEFGDTYTNLYAITGDGFGYRELKEFGDRIRAELLRVPGVAKVDFIGEQDEKIYVEMSNARLALLGVEPAQIVQTLAAQNAIAAAGVFDTASDRIYLRPTGAFDTLDAVRDIAIRANNRVFRLGDIADGFPRLRRPAAAEDALAGPRGARRRRHDGEGRRRHRPRAARSMRRLRACEAGLPVGVEIGARRQHAARGVALRPRVPALAHRSRRHRARGLAREPWAAHRARGRDLDPAGARDDVRLHGNLRHRPAQDLARCADPLARPAGRRRDHRRRDDGDQAGAGLRPLSRREFRVFAAPRFRC